MSTTIHPSAVVDPRARIGSGVAIGPWVVIEADVEIGDGCVVGPFCRLQGPTTIGPENRFQSHCSIGVAPQDLKFAGEATRLEIGSGNIFREFVTVHRGTPAGGGVTRLGSRGLYMVGTHIAHDCQVGNSVIFANNGTLAGHVEVFDHATIGAFSAIHQFCRVGEYAFLGGATIATKDCLPFMKTVGSRPARCFGPNAIGLERQGFDAHRRAALKAAWRLLHNPRLTTAEAVAEIQQSLSDSPDAIRVAGFIKSAARGAILSRG